MFKKLWRKGSTPASKEGEGASKVAEASESSKVAPLPQSASFSDTRKTTLVVGLTTDNAGQSNTAKGRRKSSVEKVDLWDLMHDLDSDEDTPAVGDLRRSIEVGLPHLSVRSPKSPVPDKQEITGLVRSALKQVLDPATGKDFEKRESGKRFIKEVLPLSAPLSRQSSQQTSPKSKQTTPRSKQTSPKPDKVAGLASPRSDTKKRGDAAMGGKAEEHSKGANSSQKIESLHGRRLLCALRDTAGIASELETKKPRSGLKASKSTGNLQDFDRQTESPVASTGVRRRIKFPVSEDIPKPARRRALSLNGGPGTGAVGTPLNVKQGSSESTCSAIVNEATADPAEIVEMSPSKVASTSNEEAATVSVTEEEGQAGVNSEPEAEESSTQTSRLERSSSAQSTSSSSGEELSSRRSSDSSMYDAFAFGSPVSHAEPLFDPEMLAAFEEDLQRLSEEEWHAKKEQEDRDAGASEELRADNRGGAAEVSVSGQASGGPLQGKDELDEVLNEVEDFLMLLEQRADDAWEQGALKAKQKGLSLPPLEIPEPAEPLANVPERKPASKAAATRKPGSGKPPLSPPRCLKAPKPMQEVTGAPPRGLDRVVLYTTSVRAVRKTFEDCNSVRAVFLGHGVAVDERDISMHGEFRDELRGLMGGPVAVPQVFIRGKYIGGFDEVQRLNDNRELLPLLGGIEGQRKRSVCSSCGDLRFVLCSKCNGSCKVVLPSSPADPVRCPSCNENGLQMCLSCA